MKLDQPEQGAAPARTRRYLMSVHLVRAFGILLIVGTHSWPGLPWTAAEEVVLPIFFRSSTVLLVFIAGFMFNYINRKPSEGGIAGYVRKRLARLWVPYVVVSIPLLLVIFLVQRRDDVWPWVYELPVALQAMVLMLTGKHMAYLWYIPALSVIVLFSALFRWIDRRNLYAWLIPLTSLTAIWLGRDSLYGLWSVAGKVIFILPSYLIGMAFCNRYVANGYRVGAAMAALCALLAAGISILYLVVPDLPVHMVWIQKIATAVLLVWLFDRWDMGESGASLLGTIADLSFGIYFLHGYVINALRLACDEGALIALLGGSVAAKIGWLIAKIVLVTLASALVCRAVRAAFGRRSRWLIGV